jgi:hypothetical protein
MGSIAERTHFMNTIGLSRSCSTLALLLFAATALGSTGCNGAPGGEGENLGEVRERQVPPFREVTEMTFSYGTSPFINVVATNFDLPVGSSFSTETEYWSGSSSTSVDTISTLNMTSSSVYHPSDANLGGFLSPNGSFNGQFSTPQFVSTSDWSRGTYSSTAAHKRLFKAQDPDDAAHSIGLVIEQDSSNVLTRTVWYKTTNTGVIFAATPSSLQFTAVVDSSNNASLDPDDIESGATWSFIEMP